MVWGDSGSKNSYAYTAMSKSSSSASNTTAATSPTASSIAMSRSSSSSSAPTSLAEALALEGFKHIDICQYKGIAQVLEAINSQSDELISGASSQQYLVFCDVTQSDLAKIDSVLPRYTRVTYYEDINLLIIKLVTVKHEAAHVNFSKKILVKAIRMGMSDDELFGVGAGRFKGSSCSKEGDTAFKPCSRDHETDLPTIVIEAGLSESLAKLRCDANWWLVHPGREGGKVMVVVIISIKQKDKSLRIEKWENAPAPARPITRANPGPPIPISIPTLIQQITIRPNATGAIRPNEVTGAPLVLEFDKIFLRQLIEPQTDFTFTANELADFATYLWNGVKSEIV
jgi:hypothetical protein